MVLDLKRQARFPGWQPRKGKRLGVQERPARQEAGGTGLTELGRNPGGSDSERGLSWTQPHGAGLLVLVSGALSILGGEISPLA